MDVTVSPCSAFSLKNTNSPRNGCCFVRCMLYSVYSRHAWKQISCVQWWKRRVLRSGFEEGGRLLKMKIQIFSNKRIYAMAYVTRKDNYFWGKIGVPFDDILLCTLVLWITRWNVACRLAVVERMCISSAFVYSVLATVGFRSNNLAGYAQRFLHATLNYRQLIFFLYV